LKPDDGNVSKQDTPTKTFKAREILPAQDEDKLWDVPSSPLPTKKVGMSSTKIKVKAMKHAVAVIDSQEPVDRINDTPEPARLGHSQLLKASTTMIAEEADAPRLDSERIGSQRTSDLPHDKRPNERPSRANNVWEMLLSEVKLPSISVLESSTVRSLGVAKSSTDIQDHLQQRQPTTSQNIGASSKKAKSSGQGHSDDKFISLEQYEASMSSVGQHETQRGSKRRRALTIITEEGSPIAQPRSMHGSRDIAATPMLHNSDRENNPDANLSNSRAAVAKLIPEVAEVADTADQVRPESKGQTPSVHMSSSPPQRRLKAAAQIYPFGSITDSARYPSRFTEQLIAVAASRSAPRDEEVRTSQQKSSAVPKVQVCDQVDRESSNAAMRREDNGEYLQIMEEAHSIRDDMDIDTDSSSDVDMDEIEAQDKAAEAEWEAALQPRHRTLLASLTRISRHFISHIATCEESLIGEIDHYFNEGSSILQNMDQKHIKQLRDLQEGWRGHSRHVAVVKTLGMEHERVRNETNQRRAAYKKMDVARARQLKDLRTAMEEGL
jgi:hypothetical protein